MAEDVEGIDWTPDFRNGVGGATGRLVTNGVRGAQVRPDASSKVQIAALLDLLALHFSNADAGGPVDPDKVTLRIPAPTPEARGALGTLVDAVAASVTIEVVEASREGGDSWVPAETGWDAADAGEYPTWPELLARPRLVPGIVSEIVRAAGLPALRAYPMLSTKDRWSVRLEGLEVGRANAKGITLSVGKDGKGSVPSAQRQTWIDATRHAQPFSTGDVDEAITPIVDFATAWHGLSENSVDHDEHALESRILRGAAPIEVGGRRLALIQGDDGVVNWGSQFPTKWGSGGSARYLDGLLRDVSTPWAIEMKVQGGAGVGQYYRHAVAQAVLYREFIRRASPLHDPWFTVRGLDATACEAAVVVPQMTNPKQAQWRDRVVRLCEVFGVAFVEVAPCHAVRSPDIVPAG